MLRRMKRLWFAIMVGMWVAFFVLVAASPETLLSIWAWVTERSWPIQVLLWIVTLPWMLALYVWQSGLADWARWLIICVVALGWTVASRPKKK